MAQNYELTLHELLGTVAKQMNVGPYEEYMYEYGCNDFDADSYNREVSRQLEKISEKIEDSDMFTDIEEYKKMLSGATGLEDLANKLKDKSLSEILKQRLQNLISFRIIAIVSLKCETSFSFCLIRCNTNLNAVFFPIPGSFANSLTAFSNKVDEKIITQK